MTLTPDNVDRLTAAAHIIRNDWSKQGLRTLLSDGRIRTRSPREVLLALMWVASEPTTLKPTRILEPGPWWEVTRPAGQPRHQAGAKFRTTRWDDCHACGLPKASHVDDDHRYEPPPRGPSQMPDDLRKSLADLRTAPPPPAPQPEEDAMTEPNTTPESEDL